MDSLSEAIQKTEEIASAYKKAKNIVVFTGAGISAESGIPVFRGNDGLWDVNPKVIATRQYFSENPEKSWEWYLGRRDNIVKAQPNDAHKIVAEMEKARKSDFTLITQNIDGLHAIAGNTPEKTLEIHGNIRKMRCFNDCGTPTSPILEIPKNPKIEELKCDRCGGWMRPNVLWFNEYYSQRYHKHKSAMAAAKSADFFLIIGTSGTLCFPQELCELAKENCAYIAEINPEKTGLTEITNTNIQDKAGTALKRIWEKIVQGDN